MDFYLADKNRIEKGILLCNKDLDLDVGDTNDFELGIAKDDSKDIDFESFLFVPNTEYGGIIRRKKTVTTSDAWSWYGDTFRGILAKDIIEPPSKEDYKTVSGEANQILRELFKDHFDNIFEVPVIDSEITIASYSFERYTTYLDGISKMLKQVNAKLKIHAEHGNAMQPFQILVEAVSIEDYSEKIEYSQDNRIELTIDDNRMGINHLICLGKGELKDRLVVHLYLQPDGTITQNRYYSGLQEQKATYANTSIDSIDQMILDGSKKLLELAGYKKMSMNVTDLELDIGDIIAARDRESNLVFSKAIIRKIVKDSNGAVSIEYKIEGEE